MITVFANDFNSWRKTARELLQDNINPFQVIWNQGSGQASLFPKEISVNPNQKTLNVPAEFLKMAEMICHHRSNEKFHLLYLMLWRLVYENKNLLKISSDNLTNILDLMKKSIRRDVHKTKAFVRFRKIYDEDGIEHYIAWHKPDHYSLKLSAPFFARRFAIMRWTILTPDESAHWNVEEIIYGPGATANDAPSEDQMEILWKEFYRAIFNPARIKIKAMKKEMPVRHWATLPEAQIIKDMLDEAPERVKKMIAHQEGYHLSARDFLPNTDQIDDLRKAAKSCQGCPLYRNATQTVFGVGNQKAELVLVGEQPGDNEDKTGEPFIGPAGQILNNALRDAGINREELYLTNSVKHFKFEKRGDMRLHRSPNLQDIVNCKAWLEAEINIIQPKLIVCLGVTASKSLISPKFKQDMRGKFITRDNFTLLSTYHPSAILRAQSQDLYIILVNDLTLAYNYIRSIKS